MKDGIPFKEEKQAGLEKYRALVLATLDYFLDDKKMLIKNSGFDSHEYFKGLKIQAEEHYQKGRLSKLKQWFRDLTEMQVESGDLKFNQYLHEKTGYEVDILKSFFERVEKVIEKGKITTDNQFYDIKILADQLSTAEPVDHARIEILNRLLFEYEQRKSRR